MAIVSVWTSSLLEVDVTHAICGFSFFLSLFFLPVCYPLRFQKSPLTCQWECFLVFGNFSSFKTTVPGQISVPTSFVSLFLFYILSYLLSKTMGWLSVCLMSSASNQKLFCGICSAFNVLSMNLWGESGLSVLFLRHLRTASDLSSALYLHSKLSFHSASDLGCKWNWTECLYVCLFLSLPLAITPATIPVLSHWHFFLWIKCLTNIATTGARIEFLLKVFVFLELLFYTHKVTQFHFLTFKP